MPDDLMTDSEILANFYMLEATIGLTRTRFGYLVAGQPGLIRAVESGRRVHEKTRAAMTVALRELIRGHAEEIPDDVKARVAEGRSPLPPDVDGIED